MVRLDLDCRHGDATQALAGDARLGTFQLQALAEAGGAQGSHRKASLTRTFVPRNDRIVVTTIADGSGRLESHSSGVAIEWT